MKALYWGIGIGAGVLLLGGILLMSEEQLAETGTIPKKDPNKKIIGRNGKDLEGQSNNVLRWAPKMRTAILENTDIPENKRVFFLRNGLAFVHHESGGDPTATSYEMTGPANAGGTYKLDANGKKIPLAKGLGQFIAGTAKTYGIEDPYNPDHMIPGMFRFLVDLWQDGGGDPLQMAQGYFSGIGNADRDIFAALEKHKALKAAGKKNSYATLLKVKSYMDYQGRLLDLYGEIT